jgi:hypothetical protein
MARQATPELDKEREKNQALTLQIDKIVKVVHLLRVKSVIII